MNPSIIDILASTELSYLPNKFLPKARVSEVWKQTAKVVGLEYVEPSAEQIEWVWRHAGVKLKENYSGVCEGTTLKLYGSNRSQILAEYKARGWREDSAVYLGDGSTWHTSYHVMVYPCTN